jgi:hypothetical protein
MSGKPKVMDGLAALEDLLGASGSDLVRVVARYCLFLDPATVGQAVGDGGEAIFPIVRGGGPKRGTFGQATDGTAVMFDDNTAPAHAFLWSAQRAPDSYSQLNHVWECAQDPKAYTALWNLCYTPFFLAKLTDKPGPVRDAVRFHAWTRFGRLPRGIDEPRKPDGYDEVEWLAPPPPADDLEHVLRARLAKSPKSRTAKCVEQLGWRFDH